jgi:hypothetical protein
MSKPTPEYYQAKADLCEKLANRADMGRQYRYGYAQHNAYDPRASRDTTNRERGRK